MVAVGGVAGWIGDVASSDVATGAGALCKMTALGEAVGRYLKVRAAGVSRTTMRTDRSHLEQFVEWRGADVDVAAIALDDVAEYITGQRERGLSPHTIQRQHAALSSLWTWFTTPISRSMRSERY